MNQQVPQFTMQQLFDASVHMGHKTMFWNPLMASYIYGKTNTVHIIDLRKSFVLLHNALCALRDCVAKGGRVLFVATKHQAVEIVKEEVKRCGQYYITKRWLGGLLTNWGTIQSTIKNMKKKRALFEDPNCNFTKKEKIQLQRKVHKMEDYFGGIADMSSLPDMIFVIDVVREHLAIKEALKMNIPVVAILDTNADPRGIEYPVPGNDDSVRAIKLYCSLVADAIIGGIKDSFSEKELKDDMVNKEKNVTKLDNNTNEKKEDEDSN